MPQYGSDAVPPDAVASFVTRADGRATGLAVFGANKQRE